MLKTSLDKLHESSHVSGDTVCRLPVVAPPCDERPSATTLYLLLCGKRSMSLTITLVRTLPPASLQTLAAALSTGNPPPTTTLACTCRQREGMVETGQEKHPERLGSHVNGQVGKTMNASDERTGLGPPQRSSLGGQGGPHFITDELGLKTAVSRCQRSHHPRSCGVVFLHHLEAVYPTSSMSCRLK